MKSLALWAPRKEGERVRRLLVEGRHLRNDLRIAAEGDRIVFPLVDRPDPPIPGTTMGDADLRPVPGERRPSDYRALLKLPETIADRLPRGFDVVGDVVLVRYPDELGPWSKEIGEALRKFVPGTRRVGRDLGVHGPERIRRLEAISGEGSWSTVHRENGLSIEVALDRAYFSPRLAREHARIAAEVRSGERVLDLCCGVGPFSLGIARAGRVREIVAVDHNPAAIELLNANLVRLGGSVRVTAVRSPLEEFLPSAGSFDRIVFNLPREGAQHLSAVATIAERGGTLYFYEVVPRAIRPSHAGELLEKLTTMSGPWRLLDEHLVHPYSPADDMVAYTFQRIGE